MSMVNLKTSCSGHLIKNDIFLTAILRILWKLLEMVDGCTPNLYPMSSSKDLGEALRET